MAFVSNDEINTIRSKANIVDIIGSYLPLTQRGKNYLCVCPFHDDHSPSMSVSQEKQIYKCFACGATGNVFTFVENYENVPFIEAVSIVADKCGMELSKDVLTNTKVDNFKEEHAIMELSQKFFQNNLKTTAGVEANKYLAERGITPEIINEFGIGLSLDEQDSLYKVLKKKYSEDKLLELGLVSSSNGNTYDMFTRRITFPLWDKDGNIVGFSARIYRGEKDTSKYVNSRETKLFKKGETLYNYHHARDVAKREKEIIVVEGFMDAIRLSVNGIKNVVALCGTALTKDQITLLKKLRVNVILCLDNDNAGELATMNNGELLEKDNVPISVIRLSGEKDPDEYIVANGIDAFKDNLKNPITFFDFKMNYYKNNKDLNNSVDLANYINEVLKDLNNSNDEILKEITLNKLSEDYGLSISVLKEKLSDIKPEKKEEKPIEVQEKKPRKKDSYTIGADNILYFMMNDGKFIKEYEAKLGFFDDEVRRAIANEILYYYQKEKKINIADFITYASSKDEIKEEVMRIVNDCNIEDELTIEAMDEYIDVVNKVLTTREIKKLKEDIKKELDESKKMKMLARMAELKRGSVDNG